MMFLDLVRELWRFIVLACMGLLMLAAAVSWYPELSGLSLSDLSSWWKQVWSVALIAVVMGVSIVTWAMMVFEENPYPNDRELFAYPSTIAWVVPILIHGLYIYTEPTVLTEFLHRYRFAIAISGAVVIGIRQWFLFPTEDRLMEGLRAASRPKSS